MTRSPDFARISLSSARWLLPWIALLLVSVSLAYAMTSAVHGGTSAGDQQPRVHAALSTGEAAPAPALEPSTTALSATSAKPDASVGTEPCWVSVGDPRYARVEMDSWIVAAARPVVCGHAALISSRSDVHHPVDWHDQP